MQDSNRKIHLTLEEMFDAVPKDKNGVGHPPQFKGSADDLSKAISVGDFLVVRLENNPACTDCGKSWDLYEAVQASR